VEESELEGVGLAGVGRAREGERRLTSHDL
jgi:hypothetical protein